MTDPHMQHLDPYESIIRFQNLEIEIDELHAEVAYYQDEADECSRELHEVRQIVARLIDLTDELNIALS